MVVAVAVVVVESIFPLEIQPCLSSRVLPFSHHRRERERERDKEKKRQRENFIVETVRFFGKKGQTQPNT